MKCPACGASGSTETLFVRRGQISGSPVWRCNTCGRGIIQRLFGLISKPIPEDIWAKMQAEWDRRMAQGFHEFERRVAEARAKREGR
jgi:hypothetical protein